MGCCRKIIYHSKTRSVLCFQWVKPVRLIALLSLIIHVGVIVLNKKLDYSIILTVVAIIHLTVVFLLLKECYVSVKYHALLQQHKYQ